NADAECNTALRGQAGVALGGAAHRVDHATKLDENSVAGALDDAPMMRGDGGIDEIAAKPAEPRKRAILIRSREPAVTDDVGDQDRCNLPGLAHGAPWPPSRLAQKPGPNLPPRYGTIQRLERDPS